MRTVLLALLTFGLGVLVGVAFIPQDAFESEAAPEPSTPADSYAVADADPVAGSAGEPAGSNAEPAEPYLAPRPSQAGGDHVSFTSRRQHVLGVIREGFARVRRSEAADMPAWLEEAALEEAALHMRQAAHNTGSWLGEYARFRSATGTLEDPVEIVIQARGTGSVNSYAAAGRRGTESLVEAPLDLRAPLAVDEPFAAYVRSGVVPLGQVFVLERIDVDLELGLNSQKPADGGRRRDGKLSVSVNRVGTVLQLKNRSFSGTGAIVGRALFARPYDAPRIAVIVRDAVVGLIARGRLVTPHEAEGIQTEVFRWVPEGDDGYLGREPVLLQVLTGHGGGNSNTVRLDGSINMYVDGHADSNLWDEEVDLRAHRGSAAWTESIGVVPQGKVFRVTAIAYRARLDPERNSHSRLEIAWQGRKLVEKRASDQTAASGTWTGEIDIGPGHEGRLTLTCAYFALGEAVVYGKLVDEPGR